GQTPAGCSPTSLKGSNPARYGSLSHPGDDYSFDIYSQAIQALRHPGGLAPLGKLKTRYVIAEGSSQSAMRLNSYIANGADTAAQVVDAFLIDADVNGAEPTTYRVPTITH